MCIIEFDTSHVDFKMKKFIIVQVMNFEYLIMSSWKTN